MNTVFRWRGQMDYAAALAQMREFTDARSADTADQVWFVEHPPVFTLGLAGRREHLLDVGTVPVVQSDRGGQVTYHGPGQIVAYLLLDLKRRKLGIKALVQKTEQAVIESLGNTDIPLSRRAGAPGIYVNDAKLAALGFRIRRGCSYHGVAVNVDPDLEPFTRINPCGYVGMQVTSLRRLGLDWPIERYGRALGAALASALALEHATIATETPAGRLAG